MPNHVLNRLTFTCSAERMAQILGEICYERTEDGQGGPGTFDFNRIRPMPESLNIESGSSTSDGIDLYLTAVNPDGADLGTEKLDRAGFEDLLRAYQGKSPCRSWNAALTPEEIGRITKYRSREELLRLGGTAVNNRVRYGAATWYEWCSSAENWNTKWNSYEPAPYAGGNSIMFQTAWSAPHPVIRALSERYPGVRILHEWADEDLGRNCGRAEYEQGKVLVFDLMDGSGASLAFAESLWETEPEEAAPVFTLRPATKAEAMYTYTQSAQIQSQTGCIGHLRADMDGTGSGFFSSWDDHRAYLKTEEFKAELGAVISALRSDPACGEPLKDRSSLASYCASRPEARMDTPENSYGFRADTDGYSYLFRLNPDDGFYNVFCYCYRRDLLDRHMKSAERGIRFIDTHYNDLFRVPDGGRVRITSRSGEQRECVCRYIDEYHAEIGSGSGALFHICEFAEHMEASGSTAEPLGPLPVTEKKPKQKGRDR